MKRFMLPCQINRFMLRCQMNRFMPHCQMKRLMLHCQNSRFYYIAKWKELCYLAKWIDLCHIAKLKDLCYVVKWQHLCYVARWKYFYYDLLDNILATLPNGKNWKLNIQERKGDWATRRPKALLLTRIDWVRIRGTTFYRPKKWSNIAKDQCSKMHRRSGLK